MLCDDVSDAETTAAAHITKAITPEGASDAELTALGEALGEVLSDAMRAGKSPLPFPRNGSRVYPSRTARLAPDPDGGAGVSR